MSTESLTVGGLRKILAESGLPDSAPVFPHWADGPPGDHEPGVQVHGFRVGTHPYSPDRSPGLIVLVSTFSLDDIDDDDDVAAVADVASLARARGITPGRLCELLGFRGGAAWAEPSTTLEDVIEAELDAEGWDDETFDAIERAISAEPKSPSSEPAT